MGRRHLVDLAQGQAVELGDRGITVDAVGLVGHQKHLLVGLAQVLGDGLIRGGQAGPRIHHEEHHVRLFDGQQGLLGHLQLDPLLGAIDTAGIDHDKFQLAQLRLAVFAVPGQAGEVGNQGIPGTGQAVEQGGFPHVGAAHQGYYRSHKSLILKTTKAPGPKTRSRIFQLSGDQGRLMAYSLPPRLCTYRVSPSTRGAAYRPLLSSCCMALMDPSVRSSQYR